jgi:hypothetical protein
MKLLVRFNPALTVEIYGKDSEQAFIKACARRIRLGQEQIDARIFKAVEAAILETIPEFKKHHTEIVFEER